MTIRELSTAKEKLQRAIIDLQKPHPFFAHLVMSLKIKEMPESSPVQTAGVDALGTLYYGEEFFMRLKQEEVAGVLCHEVLHVALLHAQRATKHNKTVANVAMDMVVNMMVERSGGNELQLPDGTIKVDVSKDSSECTFQGEEKTTNVKIERVSEKTWEEVYAEIMEQLSLDDNKPQPQQYGFDDHSQFGNDGDTGEGVTDEQRVQAQNRAQQAIADAAQYAKQMGKLPGGMERVIDELLKPKVSWRALLQKYLRPYLNPVDWSYQRPHRKSQVLGVYMPNVLREHCEVEVLVDTSGSISKKELQEFLSEILGMARAMRHATIHVTFIDSKVQARYTVTNSNERDIRNMEPAGGGGTSMERGLDYVKEQGSQAPVAVVLTDGYTPFEKSSKEYPFDVVWVITREGIPKSKVPYGVAIKMDG